MLQAAKRKPRKLTDHEKQLLPRALISNVIVFYFMTRRELWEIIGRGELRGRGGFEDVNSILLFRIKASKSLEKR